MPHLPSEAKGQASRMESAHHFSCSLAHLPANLFALVAYALALVGLGRADAPDLGRGLPHLLLVDALDRDLRRHGHLERDSLRRLHLHLVRVAPVEHEVGAAQRRAVADALDLEALLEALRDSLDHVRDERPRQAVEGAILAALGRALDEKLAVALLDRDPLRDALLQRTQGTSHHHPARVERYADPGRNGNRLLANTAHLDPPLVKMRSIFTRQSRSLRRRRRARRRCGS